MEIADEIMVMEDGIMYDIHNTQLLQDYKKLKYVPDTDRLLDWRIFLSKCSYKDHIEEYVIKREIIAVDYLLNKRYGKNKEETT